MRSPRIQHDSCLRAFSLIEVVLALGIVSFSFVGILGMIPVGMNTFRQAIDATVQAQITQQIVTQVEQTNFTDLKALSLYFDDQGTLVEDRANGIYQVAVDVTSKTTLFPSGTAGSPTVTSPIIVDNLATVKIYIVNTKDPGKDKEEDPRKNRNAKIVSMLAADHDSIALN